MENIVYGLQIRVQRYRKQFDTYSQVHKKTIKTAFLLGKILFSNLFSLLH
jgi:hypothetical protein